MNVKILAGALAAALTLAACSSTQPVQQQMGQMNQAVARSGAAADEMLFVNVPSAGNPVSNGMLLTALAAGTRSNAVDALAEILKARPKAPLGVVGQSRELNVATLKRALKDLPAAAGAGEYKVYLYATPQQLADLQQAAEGKNIRIYGLQ